MQTWSYVALGDSIPARGPTRFSYVDVLAEHVREDLRVEVSVTNLARNGWTSDDVLRRLRRDRWFRDALAGADLVTVTVGGNDLLRALRAGVAALSRGGEPLGTLLTLLPRFEANWRAVLDEIVSLRAPSEAALRATNYYDPLPGNAAFRIDGELAQRAHAFARAQNERMCEEAAARGFACADVYRAFNGPTGSESPAQRGFLWLDGFHPSEEGQRLIAATVRDLGYEPARAASRPA